MRGTSAVRKKSQHAMPSDGRRPALHAGGGFVRIHSCSLLIRTWVTLRPGSWLVVLSAALTPTQVLSGLPDETEQNPLWHYGAYVDFNYAPDFNTPHSVPFRSKLTTYRLNQVSTDLAMAYISKDASFDSPLGFEFGLMTGWDMSGQMPTSNIMSEASIIEHLARANITYQTSVGNGLKLVGGLMSSFIGYEAFYAKDNTHYSRAWGSDYSPYYLIGVGAIYPVTSKILTGAYIVTDYNYLQVINSQPKYAGQFSYQIDDHLKWSENLFVGPEQSNTAFEYWRGFLNSILEYDAGQWSVAFIGDAGSQKSAQPGHVQQLYAASSIFGRWNIEGPWTLGLRPEIYYDPNGVQTGNIQFIKALTSTLEYKVIASGITTRIRLEYRFDNSTGTQGGFYGPEGIQGSLVPSQSVIYMGLLMNFDGGFDLP